MKNASFLLDTVLTLVEHKYQVGQIISNKTDKYLFGALTDSPCLCRIPSLDFSIQDPVSGIFHSDPWSRSATLNRQRIFSIFNQNIFFKALWNMIRDFCPGGSRIRFVFYSGSPDPGVKNGLDPGSGIPSTTLPIDPPGIDTFFLWWISRMMQFWYYYRRRPDLTFQSWRSCTPTTAGSKRDGAHYPSIQMGTLFKGTSSPCPRNPIRYDKLWQFLRKTSYFVRKLLCFISSLNRKRLCYGLNLFFKTDGLSLKSIDKGSL